MTSKVLKPVQKTFLRTSRKTGTGLLIGTIIISFQWRKCKFDSKVKNPSFIDKLKSFGQTWFKYILKYPLFMLFYNLFQIQI